MIALEPEFSGNQTRPSLLFSRCVPQQREKGRSRMPNQNQNPGQQNQNPGQKPGQQQGGGQKPGQQQQDPNRQGGQGQQGQKDR
jgi:type VI secretion system secreted protein VgrG